MKRFIITVLTLCSSAAFGKSGFFWDLNDVSYLLPLPQKVQDNRLLTLDSVGPQGPLVGIDILDEIPTLTMGMTREEALQAARVLGVRIDPCFTKVSPQKCQPQIRLVWQPLAEGRRGELQAEDATLHSFYNLTPQDFSNLLRDLKYWKRKYVPETRYVPLFVHPAWEGQDDRSAAVQDFQKIILNYAGQKNLRRVTAMVLRANGTMWVFAGFEVQDRVLTMFPIPRLEGRLTQAFVNTTLQQEDMDFEGTIAPPVQGKDTLMNLIVNSQKITGKEDVVIEEAGAAYRIENPKVYTSETMDCASCHVAQGALLWVHKNKSHLEVQNVWRSEIYRNNKFNLENLTKETWHSQNVRIFGYFGKTPSVGQRVINESAEVADRLNLIAK